MATRRMILKDDVESAKWTKLSFRQRYLYWGLTLYADDDGVLLQRLINRIVLEEDNLASEEIEDDLKDLAQLRLIHIYKSKDEASHIQILFWWDKQFIAKNIYKSTQHSNSPYHLNRPLSLRKGFRPSLYDPYGIPLEQNKLGEERKDESSLVEVSKNFNSEASEEDDDLPF